MEDGSYLKSRVSSIGLFYLLKRNKLCVQIIFLITLKLEKFVSSTTTFHERKDSNEDANKHKGTNNADGNNDGVVTFNIVRRIGRRRGRTRRNIGSELNLNTCNVTPRREWVAKEEEFKRSDG